MSAAVSSSAQWCGSRITHPTKRQNRQLSPHRIAARQHSVFPDGPPVAAQMSRDKSAIIFRIDRRPLVRVRAAVAAGLIPQVRRRGRTGWRILRWCAVAISLRIIAATITRALLPAGLAVVELGADLRGVA